MQSQQKPSTPAEGEETSTDSLRALDNILTGSQDRVFTLKEVTDLIALSDLLHQNDIRKTERDVLELLEKTSSAKDQGIPSQALYRVAQDIDIPKEYVDRAIEIRHPSVEDQLADIHEYNAKPTSSAVLNTYGLSLMKTLKEKMPLDKFEAGYYGEDALLFFRISERQYKTRVLKRKKTEKNVNNLAKIKLDCFFDLKVVLNDPIFLRACGKTLEQLRNYFGEVIKEYVVKYDYVVK